ncbi:MAG: hypothetical protein GXY76_01415 [Chloroflexi bacterium]|nr:hypothetical protein [Chloroflexota bacterium]
MSGHKIVLIGAGSAMFTRGLVADLIRDGNPWRVGLVDIDPAALAVAEGLSRRLVEHAGAPIELAASTDRRDLLPGADAVVTTIAVGGRRAWEQDVFIPRRYGVYQPVGDSVTIGGIFRALRMVPALVEIARDVQRLCPTAWFMNYANPMSVNCRAIRKATGAPVVGLCHGVPEVHRYLARYMGVHPDDVTSTAVGVNHLTWFTELRYRGEDAWPLVNRRLGEEGGCSCGDAFPELGARAADAPRWRDNPFSWGLYRAFRAFPAVLDRHVSEFFPALLHEGAYYGQTLGTECFSLEQTIARGDAIYEAMRAQAAGEVPLDESLLRRPAGEGEKLIEILGALRSANGATYSVNLPNVGQVANLPRDVVLESPATATAAGLVPLALGELPAGLAAIMQRVVAVQELTAEAALAGDRKLVRQAVLADGALTDPAEARRLVDEMLAAHAAYLPQF